MALPLNLGSTSGRIGKRMDIVKESLSISVALEISDGKTTDLLKAEARTPCVP